MADKQTLILAWSGETRTHTRETFDTICDIYKPHFNLIHVGHTWSHCKEPETKDKFAYFQQTNQEELTEFMKADIVRFPLLRQDQKEKQAYRWDTDAEFMQVHSEIFKGVWGQVWSHFKSVNYIKKLNLEKEIVGIVRARWDTECPIFKKDNPNLPDDFDWCRDMQTNEKQDWYKVACKGLCYSITNNTGVVLFDSGSHVEHADHGIAKAWINDLHWIHVTSQIENYPEPEVLINEMLDASAYGRFMPRFTPSAHTLWGQVTDFMEWKMKSVVPAELCLIARRHPKVPNKFGL
jgi:hypothetical protein